MFKLNLPSYSFKMRKADGKLFIFDEFRKKYIVLTPEEWVRQNFLQFLIKERNFPSSLIANEVSLLFNGMKRRCDSIVYNRNGLPLLIVEYKAPHVEIDREVIDQIGRYNLVLAVDHLIVSNGILHYYFRRSNNSFELFSEIPNYLDL